VINHHDLQAFVRQPAGYLDRRPGMHDGVGDELAGQ